MTKSEKTSKKSTVSRTAKPAKKKFEKLDLDTFTVSLNELAYILGLASGNITVMVQNGAVVKDADGRVNLRDTVSSYCRRMRERKEGPGASKTSLELENIALKNEKLKEQLRSWRMQRDREVGLAIMQALRTAMDRLKDECKLVPAICEVIDGMLDAIDQVDLDGISYEVEGESEEDEE